MTIGMVAVARLAAMAPAVVVGDDDIGFQRNELGGKA